MLAKKHCIAMLLAGGQGSRLYALTNKIAKPAVSFGGKYRIIDFPLSNCVNSGIDRRFNAISAACVKRVYRQRATVGFRQELRRRAYSVALSGKRRVGVV